MSISRPFEVASTAVISATLPLKNAGNHDLVTRGAPCVIYEVTAVDTTPVVKVYVKASAGGTWRKWKCWQQAVDSSTRTERAPNASITLVAGDQIIVDTAGFYAVRLERQSGTSATLTARTAEEVGASSNLEKLANSASALDTNIIKHDGNEYTVQRAVSRVTGTSGTLISAVEGVYNVLLWAFVNLKTGATPDVIYISDGTDVLFCDDVIGLPLSTDGSAGPIGTQIQSPFGFKTGAVNRPITFHVPGGADCVVTYAYIQTTS